MIGKADFFCLSFYFFLCKETKRIALFCNRIIFIIDPMKHQYIKIVNTAAFQFDIKVFLTVVVWKF